MKKILLAFDGTNFSEGAFEFAKRMNEESPVLLTAVFLPQINYAELWSYAGSVTGAYIPTLEEDETNLIQKNILRFETLCRKNDLEFRLHKNYSENVIPILRKETRFADLLIIGSETFYQNLGINDPNESLRDALHASECPVLVVPEKFEFPSTNVLTYNGSKDSVYAIKQFAYLFPELCNNETILIYLNAEDEIDLPDEDLIEEFAGRHFPNLTLTSLEIEPKKYFSSWIMERKKSVVISGAFNRSVFSQIFKKSFITEVIADYKLPIFIAHL
jgi:nucleotide-binding universal stress UspA family protein